MKIHWILAVWPEPTSSAAGYRTRELLHLFKKEGHQLTVSSPCGENKFKAELEELGIPAAIYAPNDHSFDQYIAEINPEIVFFDRFMLEEQFSWRVRLACPEAIRILDTIDLHSLRRSRERIVKRGGDPLALSPTELLSEDAIREIAAIYRSDLSIVISDYELTLLTEHYKVPRELLTICRFAYASPKAVPDFDVRRDFVAIGNFNHPPNSDSFRILRNELWGRIKEKLAARGITDASLQIFGAYPKREFTELDDPRSGFRVRGWSENALETLQRFRVNLAPLRFGAGIKGKISDGWAVGTPCVATTIGAEGMTESLPFGGAVTDDWERFAECAVELYCERERWQQASAAGLRIISELYSEAIYPPLLHQVLTLRRSENTVREILWHNQFRSTEFFSRWIETKNLLVANTTR